MVDSYILENSKFAKSNLNQKSYFETLKIANWTYEEFVVSAIYFHLEHLHGSYLERKKISSNKSFF